MEREHEFQKDNALLLTTLRLALIQPSFETKCVYTLYARVEQLDNTHGSELTIQGRYMCVYPNCSC